MTFFVLWVFIFSTDISGILGGLNLAYAWSHRLFEAGLVKVWFKVDLLGDVKVFLPAPSQYISDRFFS